MQKFVKNHKRKILFGNGIAVVTLLASSAVTFNNRSAVLFLEPQGSDILLVGETRDVDVNINTKMPINAIGATIAFPKDVVDVVGISKERSFLDLWTEETTIDDNLGEVRFSGGTFKETGLIGTDTAVTLTMRAKKAGRADIHFKDVLVLSNDGTGLEIDNDARSFTFMIPEQEKAPAPTLSADTSGTQETKSDTTVPNADFNEDGEVTLTDMSILTVKMLTRYNSRYDLDMDGSLGISDISIIFSRIFGHSS